MLGSIGLMSAVYAGCGDTQEEKQRVVQLSEGCLIDSNCIDPYVCAFKVCHAMCNTDKDCVKYGYGRCMKVDGKEKAGVCQLPDERDCKEDPTLCVEDGRKQACADDGQCRDGCLEGSLSCLEGLECSVSGYCARQEELSENRELVGAGGGGSTFGAGGAPKTNGGSGGKGVLSEGGTGELGDDDGGASGAGSGANGASTTSNGGSSGSTMGGGSGESDALPDAGAGGVSGAGVAMSAGAGGDAGGGSTALVSEEEPNDDKETPNPIQAGVPVTATLGSNVDHDFYTITAPEDGAGGYYEVSFTDVGSGKLSVKFWPLIYTGAFFQRSTLGAGTSMYAYFAAAPGETYFIEVQPSGGGQPYGYDFVANYFPVPDAFEPNDTRSTAKPIALDQDVEGFLFTGYRSNAMQREEYDDWYEITVPGTGPVTLALSSVPDSLSSRVHLYGPDGGELGSKSEATRGADTQVTLEIEEAGTHWVLVTYYANPPAPAGLVTSGIPTTFTDPYTLRVSQAP